LHRYTETPYLEPQSEQTADAPDSDPSSLILQWTSAFNHFEFVTLDQAVVIGGNWWIDSDVKNLTFVGFDFRYSGSTGNALFYVNRVGSSQIDRLRFHNCHFEGMGASGAGIIDTNRVLQFEMRYCNITNWDGFAIRILDCNFFYLEYNVFTRCIGRCLEFRYTAVAQFNSNTFVDSRGGPYRGVPLVFLRGTSFNSFGFVFQACSGNNTCSVTQNVHLADVLSPDYDDTFILFSGGLLSSQNVADNAVLKARYGLSFIFSDLINPDNAYQIMLQNPLVRPSRYRLVGRDVPAGNDIRITGYRLAPVGNSWWIQYTTTNLCDFPCSDAVMQAWIVGNYTCMTNQNWSPETMPAYGDMVPRSGFWQFPNISMAIFYCQDFQIFDDGLLLPHIYVNTANGSRLYRDNLTIVSDVWLIGDSTNASCWLPMWPPCVVGQPHQVLTYRVFSDWMCWKLDQMGTFGVNHWQSLLLIQDNQQDNDPDVGTQVFPGDLRFRNNEFDGANVDLDGDTNVINVRMGSLVPPNQVLRFQTNELPAQTQAYFEVTNCTIHNYAYYPDDPVIINGTADGQNLTVDSSTFPSASGIRARSNVRIFANTSAVVQGNYFENNDNYAIWLSGKRTFSPTRANPAQDSSTTQSCTTRAGTRAVAARAICLLCAWRATHTLTTQPCGHARWACSLRCR
jgi:hypothetical protein